MAFVYLDRVYSAFIRDLSNNDRPSYWHRLVGGDASPWVLIPALAAQNTETLVALTFHSDAAGSFDDQGRLREQVAAFAQQGIWHNALTHMITLRQEQPADGSVSQDWTDFLHSVGLDAIANTAVLDCCTPRR